MSGDRTPAPWEVHAEATTECLAASGALDNLERRNAEDELGETVYADAPVEARPVLATAHVLVERGAFSQEELDAKVAEVRARFSGSRAPAPR